MRTYSLSVIKKITCVGMVGWLLATSGCAPRYFDRTPTMALHYSHVPIDPKELANLKALVAIAPKDPQAVKARFWIAQDTFNHEKYSLAEKEFLNILRHFPHSEWASPAGMMAARSQAQQAKHFEAIATLQSLLAALPPSSPDYSVIAEYGQQLIEMALTPAELVRVRKTYPGSVWDQQAAFVLAKRLLDTGHTDAALKGFQDFITTYPASRYIQAVKDLMDTAIRSVPFNHNRIGCLLPLSGNYAAYGVAIRQGLELGLQEINQTRPDNEHVGLVVADTQGSSMSAMEGLHRLAETEKVMAIIGPVLSAEAKGLLPELGRWRITMISPSAGDPGLTGASPYFFRYMLTNQQQAEAMAEYVVMTKNFHKLGILNGQDPYDRSLADAFAAKILQLGGTVEARVEYPTGQTDFKDQMMALGGVDPGTMKEYEIQERKSLEQMMDSASYDVSQRIAPGAKVPVEPVDPKHPVPQPPNKRVVILRLAEDGDQAQKEELGRVATEKFSYALAVKPGITVLTQDQTFKALKKLGLSIAALDETGGRALAEALQVDFLVMGRVKQKVSSTPLATVPGVPIPLHYQINLQLLRANNSGVLKTYSYDWTKRMASEGNTHGIEAIYLPVPAGDAVLIASQLDFYDLKLALFGSDNWLTPKLLREGGEALEGATIATGFWMDDPEPTTVNFVKAFETAFSSMPGVLSVQAYDLLRLVGQVMKNLNMAQAQREDFQQKLVETKQFPGVTGQATIGPNGDIRREPIFLELSQGQFKRVK